MAQGSGVSTIWTIGHTGWRNASFRGYADHLASAEFAEGQVIHILDAAHSTVHPFTSPAHIVQGQLSYVAPG